ncbi:MAB_1171c family putative transporter [Streptomyces sp. NRRL S-646]|uniref:MAB_1171c family putative transporter n=1 Tax=Streptomyces sp. NRRL S-646 TaxID=1463917 RepID=UPI00068AB6AA|nr:MAB_1171c family putative transporter [Streptomyces sp. NRRL S-646]
MTHDAAALGAGLQLPSVLLLWIAVLLRAPSGLRSAAQRGVLLAVATAAAAMTLDLPAVLHEAARHSEANVVAGARNALGVLSAGALLYFVAQATTDVRGLKAALALATGSVLAVLFALDLAAEPHLRIAVPVNGPPTPSLLYWLVLMSTHLGANAFCVLMCLRYSATSASRSLTLSLRLFGLGTALVGIYWLGCLLRVTTGERWPLPWLPLLMDLHGVLRALAVLVPTYSVFRRAMAGIATAWRLWPMWSDLVIAVPHVALATPRHRVWDVVWPRIPYHVLAYRRIIETRDAILALTDHGSPLAPPARSTPGPEAAADAAALAAVVKSAREAKLRGLAPTPHTSGFNSAGSTDLAGERAFLLQMAKTYRSVPTHVGPDSAPPAGS